MTKKILMTVGGTGGHVYPALALAKQLQDTVSGLEVRFAGGKLLDNPYFNAKGYKVNSISCAHLNTKNPFSLLHRAYSIVEGIWQSRQLLRTFMPDLVVGFGSYHTLPLLLAAKWGGFPIILHEANSIPGKVNRLIAPYAKVTGIHFPHASALLKGTTREVGMPLREGYRKGACDTIQAREHYRLHPNKKTLLVFGGSQGAHALNHLVVEAIGLQKELFKSQLQVLHITGNNQAVDKVLGGYLQYNVEACVKDFEHRMDLAWQASDFVVGRAGAGTIAEAMEFEVPALLIPFPYAADRHQDKNAEFMKAVVGGAEVYLEKDLTTSQLSEAIASLLDIGKLERMRGAIQKYKQEARQKDFCTLIREIL